MQGYLTNALGPMDATRQEHTSDFIPVKTGDKYVFQTWVTPTTGSSEYLWMAYQLYDSSKDLLGSRPSKYADNNTGLPQHDMYEITIPSGAAYIRISARLYSDGKMKLERGNKPTDWSPAPEDVDSAISNAAKTATSYVTDITGGGIMVHPLGNQTTGVRVTSDVDIMRNNNSVLNVGTQGDTTSTDAGVTIYDGTESKNVVARFDSDEVSLGANSNSSTIDMCGGAFKFSIDASDPDNVTGLIKVDQNAIDDHTANTPSILIAAGTSTDGRGIEIRGTPGAQYPVSIGAYDGSGIAQHVGLGSLGVKTPGIFIDGAGTFEAYSGIYVQSLTGTNFWSTVPGTVLWSGVYYMTSSHIANLTYNISTCPTGIVLHFQPYTSGTAQNYFHQYCFVPKTTVTASAGAVHNFTLCNSGFANVGMKALRIYDNRIEGIDTNDDTGTASGITFNNKYWIMTQVIAV